MRFGGDLEFIKVGFTGVSTIDVFTKVSFKAPRIALSFIESIRISDEESFSLGDDCQLLIFEILPLFYSSNGLVDCKVILISFSAVISRIPDLNTCRLCLFFPDAFLGDIN